MALTAKIGTGSSVTFSGFSGGVLSIDGPDIKLGYEDGSKMATTGAMDFLPHTLPDYGEIKVTHEWDGVTFFLLGGGSSAAMTLTLGAPSGSGGHCTAFITGFSPKWPLEGKMTAETTFKVTGGWTSS